MLLATGPCFGKKPTYVRGMSVLGRLSHFVKRDGLVVRAKRFFGDWLTWNLDWGRLQGRDATATGRLSATSSWELIVFTCWVLFGGLLPAQSAEPQPNLLGKTGEASYEGKAVLIKVGEDDLSHGQSFKFWERTLKRAEDEGATAVIFHLDTPGGLAFPTKELMSQIANLKLPTYSFIDPQAMSAGALIAIATDEIYMAPGALVGSAALVNGSGMEIDKTMRAKLESFFDAHVRWIAEKKGHRHEVIEAMMMLREEERKIGPITVPKGEILALNSKEAVQVLDDGKPLFAEDQVADLATLYTLKGIKSDQVLEAVPTGFEKMAWWIAGASGLLILVGLGGGYLELKTPGFGIGGVISLTAFSLFFFGNYVAGNLAGYELAAVFLLGIGLILVEIFVIPGFGVAGITGLLMVVGSLTFAMVDRVEWREFQWDRVSLADAIAGPALNLGLGILGSLVLLYLIMRFLPTVPLFNRVILNEALSAGPGTFEDRVGTLTGQLAVALTDLRPAGKVEVAGETRDASVESGFLPKGSEVRVTKDGAMGLVVEPV